MRSNCALISVASGESWRTIQGTPAASPRILAGTARQGRPATTARDAQFANLAHLDVAGYRHGGAALVSLRSGNACLLVSSNHRSGSQPKMPAATAVDARSLPPAESEGSSRALWPHGRAPPSARDRCATEALAGQPSRPRGLSLDARRFFRTHAHGRVGLASSRPLRSRSDLAALDEVAATELLGSRRWLGAVWRGPGLLGQRGERRRSAEPPRSSRCQRSSA